MSNFPPPQHETSGADLHDSTWSVPTFPLTRAPTCLARSEAVLLRTGGPNPRAGSPLPPKSDNPGPDEASAVSLPNVKESRGADPHPLGMHTKGGGRSRRAEGATNTNASTGARISNQAEC